MKYKTINELDQRIENIISRTVKHYYTDWKNYDRPKYMGLKGSDKKEDKKVILIARECGTYLVKISDMAAGDDWANTLYDYFINQEKADYYFIDIEKLIIIRMQRPELFKKDLIKAA